MAHTIKPPNPFPCGCGIMGTPTISFEGTRTEHTNLFIRFCPLHTAAPKLLEALTELLRVDDEWHGSVNSEMSNARQAARTAIKEAEGR